MATSGGGWKKVLKLIGGRAAISRGGVEKVSNLMSKGWAVNRGGEKANICIG